MWRIIYDTSTIDYLVIHETRRGYTDKILRTFNGDCWTSNLVYDTVSKDEQPEMLDELLEYNDSYTILHSFESDDPLTYLQNLPSTHPEFYI